MKTLRLLVMAMAATAIGLAAVPAHAHRGWYGGAYGGWYGPGFNVYFGAPALAGPYAYPYYYAPGYYRYPPYPYAYPPYAYRYSPYAYRYPPYAYPYPAYVYRGPTVYVQKPRVVAAAPPPPRSTARAPVAKPAPAFERYSLAARELFAFDSARLTLPQPKLDEIALALVRHPGITGVRISGYTDHLGSDAYNRELSQRRADAVKAYLVGQGVAANRLVAVGYGEANPVVTCNETSRQRLIACLEPNRRVEIEPIVIEQPAG